MNTRHLLFLVACLIGLLAARANAAPQIIFNSTGQTDDTTDSVVNSGPLAASFVTPGYTGSLYSLALELSCACSTSKGAFDIELLTNSTTGIPGTASIIADVPGTLIATDQVLDSSLPNSSSNKLQLDTFENPFGNLQLLPDTAYWIELVNAPVSIATKTYNTNADWELVKLGSPPNNSPGTGVADNYLYDDALNGNANCTAVSADGCGFLNNGSSTKIPSKVRNDAFGMQIEYTPEPGALALVGSGLVFLAGLRRRR